ncbi:hypothetical protein PFISCL1PPCAC_28840, partial [Pristionchus fissidentatus]
DPMASVDAVVDCEKFSMKAFLVTSNTNNADQSVKAAKDEHEQYSWQHPLLLTVILLATALITWRIISAFAARCKAREHPDLDWKATPTWAKSPPEYR